MTDEVAIKVEHVSKKYCKSLKRSMLYGIKDIGRNILGMSSHPENLRKSEFWALDDISFEVKKGETLGIIGPNGSGKTTLLKLLNGIFWPDKGKITVNGKMGALIQVGAGFHPLLTGRENVYLNAAILGMTKKEVDEKFDSIVEFADIGDFLDTPVKYYSSGMFVRLGFAVAVHCEPEILLVDEILAVGDISFQSKCHQKFRELRESGVAIVFVTHNLPQVLQICNKCLVFNSGICKYEGPVTGAIETYKNLLGGSIWVADQDTKSGLRIEHSLYGDIINNRNFVDNVSIHIKSNGMISKEVLKSGADLRIHFSVHFTKPTDDLYVGIVFYRNDGFRIAGFNSKFDTNQIIGSTKNIKGVVSISNLAFVSGRYLMVFEVSSGLEKIYRDIKYSFILTSSRTLDDNSPVFLERKWFIEYNNK